MKPEQLCRLRSVVGRILRPAVFVLIALLQPAAAQDIRGMEVCTAEKQMDRRTSCLQANVEFLQQALNKLAHDSSDKQTAADRDLAAARAEIVALRSAVDKLNSDLKDMKAKADADRKK
jgi:hypothetical protein